MKKVRRSVIKSKIYPFVSATSTFANKMKNSIQLFKNKGRVKYLLCIVVILFSFISQSCSTTSKSEKYRHNMETLAKENTRCCVEKVYVGSEIIINRNKEIEIASVIDDSPAAKAGILPGDVVLKIDNEEIKDKYRAFILYDNKYPGDTSSLTIKRKGKIITKQLQFESLYFLNVQYALTELIYKDIPVRLAVIFGNIDFGHSYVKEHFKKQQESYYVGLIESSFISTFRNQSNFIIIDRQKTDVVLNELKFQESGLVDNKSREKLGSMLGATHLLVTDISFSGFIDNNAEYLYVMRLMEISSGKTLAISTFKNKFKEHFNLVKIDLYSYYDKLKKIAVFEKDATTAYSSITGSNYKNDNEFSNVLINIVIPKYKEFTKHLMNITPETNEVRNAHQLYIEGANLQQQAFQTYQTALTKNDRILFDKGNQTMGLAKQKMEEFQIKMEKLSKR